MKRTLQDLKISNRLDTSARSPRPNGEDSKLVASVDSMTVVDERLRASITAAPEPPPWLHASIMNEVRREATAAPAHASQHGFPAGWVSAMAAVVLIAVVGGLMTSSQPGEGTVLNSSYADADGMVRAAASQSAVALIEPFEAELANLSRDLDRTTGFLLASLP